MKTYYVICDKTANTGREYIGEGWQNVSLLENSLKFETRQEAEKVIEDNAWKVWAVIREEVSYV